MATRSGFMFPKNTVMTDQRNSWTFKPVPLRLESAAVLAKGF
jgi:hypothetical protein